MSTDVKLNINTRWDKSVVAADEPMERGLLVEVGATSKMENEHRPVNLALVIDRSGSMDGERIAEAKEAVRGVVSRLEKTDRLSIVSFDHEIAVHVAGLTMNRTGKAKAIAAVDSLGARGTTDLGGGWFEGADAVARVIEETSFTDGHVVLLSDGHANRGLTDPEALTKHAAEMARRGVTTSTVGIGSDFSPLQLDALAEGGRGRLHVASSADEIADVVIGEIHGAQAVVVKDIELVVRWPGRLRVEKLSHFDTTRNETKMKVRLGELGSGSKRSVPLLVGAPSMPKGKTVDIEVKAKGIDAVTGDKLKFGKVTATLKVVSAREEKRTPRDEQVVERIGRLWESKVAFDAMRANEAGDFDVAIRMVRNGSLALGEFTKDTAAAERISDELHLMEAKVATPWVGTSKREAMIKSKKFMRSEEDHRPDEDDDWSKHI